MLRDFLRQLLSGSSLGVKEAESAMEAILGETDPHQIAAFLTLLRFRGETVDEVVGMVRALERRAVAVRFPGPTLDIVGTGGDLAGTVNISTGSALLAATCGIPIAKHGNRSVSSRSGSADLLEALGIRIEASADELLNSLTNVGIAFLYAPHYHPSLKQVAPIRRGLKFPTVFNLLGPLLNPAKPEFALIGVARETDLELIAKVILRSGEKKRALVFHGSGLDELSTLGPMTGYDVHEGEMKKLEIDPIALGFRPCCLKDLQGGDAQLNGSILHEVFAGKECPVADALLLNAGAALWIFGKAVSLQEGIQIARGPLREGKVLTLLEEWRAL